MMPSSAAKVTGSNSVNVFLGIGLPWLLASFYWYMQASCTCKQGESIDSAKPPPYSTFRVQPFGASWKAKGDSSRDS